MLQGKADRQTEIVTIFPADVSANLLFLHFRDFPDNFSAPTATSR